MKQILARLALFAILSVPTLVLGYLTGGSIVGILRLHLETPIILTIGILTIAFWVGVVFGSLALFTRAAENA